MSASLAFALVLAQSVPIDADAAALRRIRKALAEPAPVVVTTHSDGKDGPVFRMRIQGLDLADAWADRSMVPPYVRPWFPSYHHEFLEQVLKNRERAEQFRGPTLYPVGIDMVQVGQFLARQIKAANRRRQEQHAREEVRQAIEQLRACRANPDRAGC